MPTRNPAHPRPDSTKSRRVVALAMDLYMRNWVKPVQHGELPDEDPNEFLPADCIDAAEKFYAEADRWTKEQES